MKTDAQAKSRDWVRKAEKGILPFLPDETLDERWNRFRVDPVAYIEANHFLEYLEPQANWTSGCPLGNGDMGVMAYGPPEATIFMLGKTDLWDYTPFGESNFAAGDIETIREIIKNRDEERFRELTRNKKIKRDAPTGKTGGILRLELFPSAIISQFRQRLSYANAEVVQTWRPCGDRRLYKRTPHQKVRMTSFVHAARNVLVVHIEPGEDLPWREPVFLSLWRYEDPDMRTTEYHAEGNIGWYRQELPGGEHFIAMVATDSEDLEIVEAAGRIMAKGVPRKKTLTLYVTLVTSLDTDDAFSRARENIADARDAGFEKLHRTHLDWWHNFWRRGYVITPWKKVEEKWYYALYLHASIARPGCMSPGLQGNWIKEHYPAWNADFHNNINMQIVYWGHYTANRLELGEPFYRLFSSVLDRCKKDTKKYFKMRGARFPISMGPDGCETAPGLMLQTWIGAGGWLALHFWWHWRYSQDKEFLRKFAYPIVRECALFYEDYLQEDEDGRLCAFPTIHMEMMAGYLDGFGKNSIWDLPIVIRTFQMAIEGSCELGVDEKDRQRWKEILHRIAPLPANEEGVWMEFADKRGLLHIWDWARFMPVFPMELVGEDSGPKELRSQARKSIEEYYRFRGEKAKEVGGFSGAFFAAGLARMGDGERALEMAEYVADGLNSSGLVYKRDAFYLQVDTPPGLDIFLNEMLLQSCDGIIRLFPATPPSEEDVRFHSLRAQGGFLVSAERRKNLTMYVVIKSLYGNRLRMRNPFVGEPDRGVQVKVYRLEKDTVFTPESQMKMSQGLVPGAVVLDRLFLPGEIIEFPTEKGRAYMISKEIPWISDVPVVDVAVRSE